MWYHHQTFFFSKQIKIHRHPRGFCYKLAPLLLMKSLPMNKFPPKKEQLFQGGKEKMLCKCWWLLKEWRWGPNEKSVLRYIAVLVWKIAIHNSGNSHRDSLWYPVQSRGVTTGVDNSLKLYDNARESLGKANAVTRWKLLPWLPWHSHP